MTVRLTATSCLCLSAIFAAGCQNTGPYVGQSPMGGGSYGPHVAAHQQPAGDPFMNAERPHATMNSAHVRVAGMQRPQVQATSNVSPTIIQTADYQQTTMPPGYPPQTTMPAGYQQPVQPAGYRPSAGPFNPAATMPANQPAGWQSSQSPVVTKPY